MSTRLDLFRGSVLPWQFPPLDRVPLAPSNGAAARPEHELPSVPVEPASPGASDGLAELREEQIARGYAEGFDRGLAEGREQGYAAGFEEGARAAEEHLAAEAGRLAAIGAGLAAPISSLDQAVEEAVLTLALEVARCVIGQEVSHSREYLIRLVREAIAKVPLDMGAPRIVLNRSDLDLVHAFVGEIEQAGITLIGDDSVEPGGCLVIANGEGVGDRDVHWHPRAGEGGSQVDLTLASRWRSVMLSLFDSEES